MQTVQELKNLYVAKAGARYNEAVETFRQLKKHYPEELQFVINNWDVLDNDLSWPWEWTQAVYSFPREIVEAVHFLHFFISHEFHDDGEPSLAWVVLNVEHPTSNGVENLLEYMTKLRKAREACDYILSEPTNPRARPILLRTPDATSVHPCLKGEYLVSVLDLQQPVTHISTLHKNARDRWTDLHNISKTEEKPSSIQLELQQLWAAL